MGGLQADHQIAVKTDDLIGGRAAGQDGRVHVGSPLRGEAASLVPQARIPESAVSATEKAPLAKVGGMAGAVSAQAVGHRAAWCGRRRWW